MNTLRNLLIAFLSILKITTGYSQESRDIYHLQTYQSIMEIENYPQIDSLTIDTYLSKYWTSFILSNGTHNYFNEILLSTDLLRFQNHNLFSRYPIKCLTGDFEHIFTISGDSLTFWFGGMDMHEEIKIPFNDSTFVLFPTGPKKPLIIIQEINKSTYRYTTYGINKNAYSIETSTRSRNQFKHRLGIKNKKNLLVLLFKNPANS